MPKKKQKNSFYFFMKDLQEKYKKQGKLYSMVQMPELAHPIWRSMTAAEREQFEKQAKVYKKQTSGIEYKLASDGTSVLENIELSEEEKNRERQMLLDVQQYIAAYDDGGDSLKDIIISQKFYIACFNILCHTEDEYIPLEIGISEYCINKGITSVYHKFINPGGVPTGFTGEAKRHSESTHQIPFHGHETSERDYRKIWKEIVDFINPHEADDLPPVFCPWEVIEQTLGCFIWLQYRAGVRYGSVRVWDLAFLMQELRFCVNQRFPSTMIARDLLKNNSFDYTIDTRCDFHEELDSPYCAIGYARRLSFLMSDSLCGVFNITPTDKHLPLRASESKPYEIHHPNIKTSKEFNEPLVLSRYAKSSSRRQLGFGGYLGGDEDDDDDTDSSSVVSGRTYSSLTSSFSSLSNPSSLSQGMSQLRLNAPAVAPGQGIGRGRRQYS